MNNQPSLATKRVGLARKLFVVGSIGFIFIGALHTFVHFTELAGQSLKERFLAFGGIEVSGQTSPAWDLFQGTSILMGLFSLGIGFIDLGALRATGQDRLPPTTVALTNIVILVAIIAVGATYLGPLQIFGGLFGIAVFCVGPIMASAGSRFAPHPAAQ